MSASILPRRERNPSFTQVSLSYVHLTCNVYDSLSALWEVLHVLSLSEIIRSAYLYPFYRKYEYHFRARGPSRGIHLVPVGSSGHGQVTEEQT